MALLSPPPRLPTKSGLSPLPLLPPHWFSTQCSHDSPFHSQRFPYLQEIHTQTLAENCRYPQQSRHILPTIPTSSISPMLQYFAEVIYTEPHNLRHHLHRPFPWQYNKIIFRCLCRIQPGFQRCEFSEIFTMLPALNEMSIKQFIYCHHDSPGLQLYVSTRWTGQMRLTDSQGAIHESWMARWSPRAPGFSSEQYA